MIDIVTVVDEMIRFGNFSAIFSPVSDDSFLTGSGNNFLRERPIEALRRGNFKKVPILTGMMSEEGVLMGYFIKSQLDQLQTQDIANFMETFVLSQLLRQLPFDNSESVRNIINHEYFPDLSIRSGVYNQIIDFFTDVYFDAPMHALMDSMASAGAEIYSYINDYTSVDIFGNALLNRTAAAHGTDLLYLFGPTMYKNFFNTDFQSFSEGGMAKNLKSIIGEFTIYGAPISLTNSATWNEYNRDRKNYYNLYGGFSSSNYKGGHASQFWYNYLPNLVQNLKDNDSNQSVISQQIQQSNACFIYEISTWILLFTCISMMMGFCIALCLVFRRSKGKKLIGKAQLLNSLLVLIFYLSFIDNHHHPASTIFTMPNVPLPQIPPVPSSQPPGNQRSSRWREAITEYSV